LSWLLDLPELLAEPSGLVALLADLHGNLPALQAVLAELERRGIADALVLGDLVGYGPWPAEVVAGVRARGWPAIGGNHEQMLLGRAPDHLVPKPWALEALRWTAARLTAGDLAYLEGLPLCGRMGTGWIAVHGALVDQRHCYAYTYDLSLDLNVRKLRELGLPAGVVVATGHTHRAAVFEVERDDWRAVDARQGPVTLAADCAYFVNPGSVGYPRDGDPRASFAIWDAGRRQLEVVRVGYPVAETVAALRQAGFDERFVERLQLAR
jgi:predicted phosphodiesterase